MTIQNLLEQLKHVCSESNISEERIKSAIAAILLWLNDSDNNTDENCRRISIFIVTQVSNNVYERLPQDIQEVLFDMGAALYDTHTATQVAENFSSTPQQLLDRIKKM